VVAVADRPASAEVRRGSLDKVAGCVERVPRQSGVRTVDRGSTSAEVELDPRDVLRGVRDADEPRERVERVGRANLAVAEVFDGSDLLPATVDECLTHARTSCSGGKRILSRDRWSENPGARHRLLSCSGARGLSGAFDRAKVNNDVHPCYGPT